MWLNITTPITTHQAETVSLLRSLKACGRQPRTAKKNSEACGEEP